MEIRSGSDEGVPIVMSNPDSVISQVYGNVAEKVVMRLEEVDKEQHFRPDCKFSVQGEEI